MFFSVVLNAGQIITAVCTNCILCIVVTFGCKLLQKKLNIKTITAPIRPCLELSMYLVRQCVYVCVCVHVLHSGMRKAPLIGLLYKSTLVETEPGN